MAVLTGAQIVVAVAVALSILLQTPNAVGMGGTFGSSSSGGGYRRRRGLEGTLLRMCIILVILFAALSIAQIAINK